MSDIDHCINSVLDNIREHAMLMQRAISEPNNRVEITYLIQKGSDRSIALDIECKNDSDDDKIHMKVHPEIADNIFEMIGHSYTLELKLKYVLDEDIPDDIKLLRVLDLWGEHDPSAWDNIE